MTAPALECRSCHGPLGDPVLDLGLQPVLDEPVPADRALAVPQAPVLVRLCRSCSLVQIDPPSAADGAGGDDAAIASALANAKHGHARRRPGGMTDHLAAWASSVLAETSMPKGSLVIDVASGDGVLLEQFMAAGMSVLGHASTPSLAAAANVAGIRTISTAFGAPDSVALIEARGGAELILVNHALAHVDDLDAMVSLLETSLAPVGRIAIEFHDLTALLAGIQFDIVGHAHRSYLSLTALERLLVRHGLSVIAARRSAVHGGTIQALVERTTSGVGRRAKIDRLLARDASAGVEDPATFVRLGVRAHLAAARFRQHLESAAQAGTVVVGYGAPGRSVALLAMAGVGSALLPFTVDRDPEKQGLSLPGAAIEIRDVNAIDEQRPDEVMILAWSWAAEIASQLAHVATWGGRLVVPLPRLRAVSAGRPTRT
ncbi:MAG: methyltransferase domain-containing protein [Chloroflexi bacterium]|nr:methyltransferase domain-containing protein [Chloroflexota bacterium]